MPREPDECEQIPDSLLVRRAGPDATRSLAAVMTSISGPELRDCAAAGGLFVLADVVWDAAVRPLAAAAFSLDMSGRRASLRGMAVPGDGSARRLGERLLAGAAMLLRAEGIEAVEADAGKSPGLAGLLRSAGFEEVGGGQLVYWL